MSRAFGPVMQNGYLVRDLDAALAHWTGVLGVGPFFVIERLALVDARYRGEPFEADVTIALACSGGLQIELIRQRDDAPSIYREWYDAGREGLHHLGFYCEDIAATLASLGDGRYERVQWGTTSGGGGFAYLATEAHPGTCVELIQRDEAMRRLFEIVESASRDWDGSEPVRRLR